ncbi:hypothetical protein V7S43_018895 [Phytophthora oleae]|uniref:Uncharacterized protein n=1 Tax=Phytophthora oleae TaxID=2107226 RepID=A0ABD3EPA0_9STRA
MFAKLRQRASSEKSAEVGDGHHPWCAEERHVPSEAGSPEVTSEPTAPSGDAAARAGALELPSCGTTVSSPPLHAEEAVAEARVPPEASPASKERGEFPLDKISLPSDTCVER